MEELRNAALVAVTVVNDMMDVKSLALRFF